VTQPADARQRAAICVLEVLSQHACCFPHGWSYQERQDVLAELKSIEKWLIARAAASDARVLRAIGKESARAVRMSKRTVRGVR
jgi:hypothetical protein